MFDNDFFLSERFIQTPCDLFVTVQKTDIPGESRKYKVIMCTLWWFPYIIYDVEDLKIGLKESPRKCSWKRCFL